ncbi:MAG: GTP cyclohydrolase II [bacterium]
MALKSKTTLQTKRGIFEVGYYVVDGNPYVSFRYGDVSQGRPIVRLQSACLFGEAFGSLECECGAQLAKALDAIVSRGAGLVLYAYAEGRGAGLEKKIEAMEIQRTTGCNTVEAFDSLGLEKSDYRDYQAEVNILTELGTSLHICLFSKNPARYQALKDAGFDVDPYE